MRCETFWKSIKSHSRRAERKRAEHGILCTTFALDKFKSNELWLLFLVVEAIKPNREPLQNMLIMNSFEYFDNLSNLYSFNKSRMAVLLVLTHIYTNAMPKYSYLATLTAQNPCLQMNGAHMLWIIFGLYKIQTIYSHNINSSCLYFCFVVSCSAMFFCFIRSVGALIRKTSITTRLWSNFHRWFNDNNNSKSNKTNTSPIQFVRIIVSNCVKWHGIA